MQLILSRRRVIFLAAAGFTRFPDESEVFMVSLAQGMQIPWRDLSV